MATSLSLSAGLSTVPPITFGVLQLDGLGFATIVTISMYMILARLPQSLFGAKDEESRVREMEEGGDVATEGSYKVEDNGVSGERKARKSSRKSYTVRH
jgi:hypothetical protein